MLLSILPQDIELTPERQKTLAHSKTVANAAKLIAEKTSHLDPEKAYGFGLMHDIGKFYLEKSEYYKHPLWGYRLLLEKQPETAVICLTHAFLDFESYDHILSFCHDDQYEADEIIRILKTVSPDDYIGLIQLCDKLSGLNNYVTIEEKLEWYQNTSGISKEALESYYLKHLCDLKSKFDKLTGDDIYSILGM